MDDLGQYLLIALGLLCVLPLVTIAVLIFIVYRAGQQRLEAWLAPDVTKLQQQFDDLRVRHPDATQDELVARIIHGQAVRCGIVGAVTSVGGLITLPVALPIDIVLSFRIQAALINFIAHLYNGDNPENAGATVRGYLVMTGSSRVTQTSTRFLTGLAVRVIGKSFAKLVPLVGAVIGFGVNYAIVQAMGRGAARWYTRRKPA
jgi:uncharacterized protein (DUF697 family)